MAEFYDPSFVESGVFSPDSLSRQNAGLLHNHFLYITYKTRFSLGANPNLAALQKEIEARTIALEEIDQLPGGSIPLVNEMNKFMAGYSEKTFQPGIDRLAAMYRLVLSDPKFRDTNLVIVFSIAYYSAVFWSQMQVTSGGGGGGNVEKSGSGGKPVVSGTVDCGGNVEVGEDDGAGAKLGTAFSASSTAA